MLHVFSQFHSILDFTFKRLAAQRWLALSTAFGLVVSVALVMSIPLYADATHFRLLRERLLGESVSDPQTPLEFQFYFKAPRTGGPQWDDLQAADSYLWNAAASDLGLKLVDKVRQFKTDTFKVFPVYDPQIPDTKYYINYIQFGVLADMQVHVRLVAGEFPSNSPGAGSNGNSAAVEPVEVMVPESASLEFGFEPGTVYYARRNDDLEIPIRVTGIWAPVNPDALYWESPQKLFLVNEAAYANRISPLLEDEGFASRWYLSVDGSSLHAGDVPYLLEHIQNVRQRVENLLPGTELEVSPLTELEQYQQDAPTLTLLLYAFSIPIIGLILAFIGLVAGLFVQQHQNEMAVLRSRGASITQVVAITAIEGLVLGLLALLIGIPIGESVAQAIGHARSFLNFSGAGGLRVTLTRATLGFGLASTGLVLCTQIIVPSIGASRRTIITYKQEQARSVRAPWWQRAWIDILLMLPAAYGVYTLRQQGSIANAGEVVVDPLHNPLLLLVPALVIFALSLFILRLVPLIMRFIAWTMAQTRSVSLVTAARYLSRTPAFYSTPLVLLVLTLSLSAFTASLAQTLDHHLYRQLYYKNGTDLTLFELGITPNEGSQVGGRPLQSSSSSEGNSEAAWIFNPVEEHLRLPGVQAASRVASFSTEVMRVNGSPVSGKLFGIDRLTFPQVAFWQTDFSSESLGALMNDLALNPENVLVSRDFMEKEALKTGDVLNVVLKMEGSSIVLKTRVAGSLDLFPTWYPDDGPLVVANLDYIFQQIGSDLPHFVWLKTSPNADYNYIAAAVRGYTDLLDPSADKNNIVKDGLNIFIDGWTATPVEIAAAQRQPERQGLFGLLSVGFAASALLTVVGFLLYAFFSFRRRFIELGVLRAVGLSRSQLIGLLAWELAFLIGIGITAGTALGVWVSRLFIPYLQVGVENSAHFPPFIVEIAWSSIFQIYGLFGMLFVVALSLLAARLLKMKIFQAIKLGETA